MTISRESRSWPIGGLPLSNRPAFSDTRDFQRRELSPKQKRRSCFRFLVLKDFREGNGSRGTKSRWQLYRKYCCGLQCTRVRNSVRSKYSYGCYHAHSRGCENFASQHSASDSFRLRTAVHHEFPHEEDSCYWRTL